MVFSAYFASIMVLKEQMAYMYGEEFCGLLVDKIEEANHKRSTTSNHVYTERTSVNKTMSFEI